MPKTGFLIKTIKAHSFLFVPLMIAVAASGCASNLSGYYSDPETTDLYTEVSNNVIKSAEVLENVMSQALENGFGVQDAVNMTRAMRAYQANCAVAKTTFEIKL